MKRSRNSRDERGITLPSTRSNWPRKAAQSPPDSKADLYSRRGDIGASEVMAGTIEIVSVTQKRGRRRCYSRLVSNSRSICLKSLLLRRSKRSPTSDRIPFVVVSTPCADCQSHPTIEAI